MSEQPFKNEDVLWHDDHGGTCDVYFRNAQAEYGISHVWTTQAGFWHSHYDVTSALARLLRQFAEKKKEMAAANEKIEEGNKIMRELTETIDGFQKQDERLRNRVAELEEKIAELEKDKQDVEASALRLLTGDCEKHCGEIRSLSFSEFVERIRGHECGLCTIDAFTTAQVRVTELESLLKVEQTDHELAETYADKHFMRTKELEEKIAELETKLAKCRDALTHEEHMI